MTFSTPPDEPAAPGQAGRVIAVMADRETRSPDSGHSEWMRRRRRSLHTVGLTLAAALLLTGCPPAAEPAPEPDDGDPSPAGSASPTEPSTHALQLSSPDFADGGPIPDAFTCAETGRIPTLEWTGVPENAESLALTVLDPDAPGGTFVHWVIYDLDPSLTGFPEGRYPADATQAVNSAGLEGWFPPCPPPDDGAHRYEFTLHALEARDYGGTVDALVSGSSSIARASLTGTVDLK